MCDEIWDKHSDWLPEAYLKNAKCACLSLPQDDAYANCIRNFLRDKLNSEYSEEFKEKLKKLKKDRQNKIFDLKYYKALREEFVPKVYDDHLQAYEKCLCDGKPAFYQSWLCVSCVDLKDCALIKKAIMTFGKCNRQGW